MSEGTTPKLAGKYTSVEELEKGYSELMREIARVKDSGAQQAARAEALDRYSKQLEATLGQFANQTTPPQQANLMDDNGQLNERALQALIDQRLKPIEEQVKQIPTTIQESIVGVFAPVQRQMASAATFWSRTDVEDSKFSQAELTRFTQSNDGIRKVYETLLQNPETAESAYDYAFTQWKATRQPGQSRVNPSAKLAAGQPSSMGGPPLASPEDEGSWKRIQALEAEAAQTGNQHAAVEALKERLKGTKMLQDLQNYAEEKGWKP